MFIEAVSVCVNYSDYLAWTIGQNRKFFDSWIIVTSNNDKNTIKLCDHYNVRCLQTNIFEEHYNKGEAINLGLKQLKRTGWLCHIDSDIYLPERTKDFLKLAKLDPTKLYGIDRLNVDGFDTWIKHLSNPTLLYENQIYAHQWLFRAGSRVVKTWCEPGFTADLGYHPIGYFQLWSEPDGVARIYPENNRDFSRSDMEFSGLWTRDKRELIPEIISLHLMGKGESKGCNWNGRKSSRFDLTELQS